MLYFAIGIAGMVGSLLRYMTGLALPHGGADAFPLNTLFVNLIGCFLLSWLTFHKFGIRVPDWLRTAVGTGLIGSFTTFSTLSLETAQFIQYHRWGYAIGYVLISLWGGILMAWLGYRAACRLRQADH